MKKTWSIITSPCPVCSSDEAFTRFTKKGAHDRDYTLVSCSACGLEYLYPRPTEHELNSCYQSDYFTKRTDRGYDNYFSAEIRYEIERVIALNLKGLSFERFEESNPFMKRSLDIGCAAGYFVHYLATRGWNAQGIEVSSPCVRFAREKLSLNVIEADYRVTEYREKFDLVTLWATIEHLPDPAFVIKKAFDDLREGGMLYISTCRQGGINFQRLFGPAWRYYNFPEHLYFFSMPNLKTLLRKQGFTIKKTFTYGSGYGRPKTLVRKIADFIARRGAGDMMVISAVKDRSRGKRHV